jgi:hypothetical protein
MAVPPQDEMLRDVYKTRELDSPCPKPSSSVHIWAAHASIRFEFRRRARRGPGRGAINEDKTTNTPASFLPTANGQKICSDVSAPCNSADLTAL